MSSTFRLSHNPIETRLRISIQSLGFDKKGQRVEEPVLDVEDGMDDGDEAFQPLLPPVKSKS